jgi:hypothetical protein
MTSFRRAVPFLLFGLAMALAAAAPASAQCSTSVNQWRRWECALTSTNDYLLPGNNGNPYRDLEIKVTYRNTSTNETFSSFGFWDGDLTAAKRKAFKIRGAFPAGTWRWSTSCRLRPTPPAHSATLPNCAADTGLNLAESPAREITSQGVIIGDGNELYNRGFLKKATGASPRHMAHGDGSPFYWLGDTAWAASMRASTAGDFETYLSNRAFRSQVDPSYPPFTVIQMAPAPMWAGQKDGAGNPNLLNGIPIDTQGRRPFEQIPGCTAAGNPPNNCSRWVTAFWQDFDQKVQNANVHGLAVFVAGVMNPLGENGTVIVPPTAEAQIFARNFVGRLFGNFVIFSPGFDARPSNFLPLIKTVGCTIEQATCNVGTPATACGNGCKSSRHLIANHPGGGSSLAELQSVQGEPWLAFQMFQSGQAVSACADADDTTTTPTEISCQLREMTNRARALPLTLQSATPTPNVNGESIYEGVTTFTGVNYTAYRVRQTAYLSTLSGSLGYTFGACGLFNWGNGGVCPGWQPGTTILRESSKQMRYLANFYQVTFWQRLVGNQTEHNRITNQTASTPNDQKMVLARDGNSTVFAYLPKEQTQIEINLGVLSNFPANWTAKWCNPRNGQCTTTAAQGIGGTSYRFTPPPCVGCDASDWLLKLVNTTPSSAAAKLTASRMEVWEVSDEEGSGSRIAARIDDASGLARKDEFEVSSRKGFGRFPSVAKEGGGQFTVAWQSDMQDGELGGIYARRYDNRGNPLGEEFQVNEKAEGDQFHPSITANASGDSVIVWSSRGQDGDGSGVFARRYDQKGSPAGGELQVNTSTSGDQGFARVGLSPSGDFAVAWESESEETGSAIFAQVFDRSGRRLGPEIRVDATPRGRLSLASVEMSPAGEAVVVWEQFGDDTVTLGRFGQRYDRLGAAISRFAIAD